MKITFLGNFQVEHSSETHHKKSLEALGHEVVALQETQASSELVLGTAIQSDMFVWVHTHGWDTPGSTSMETVLKTLKANNVPSVTYHLDLWLGLQRQQDLDRDAVYKHIDHFFTVDKQMADWFNNNTEVNGHYLPAAVYKGECRMVARFGHPRNDVIFVGSRGYHPEHAYRPQLIDWLRQTYGRRFQHWGGDGLGIVRGDKLNQLYSNTKVVVGDSLCINFDYPYYWSDRVYETMGRGGFIIHPYIKGMEEHFNDKEHLVFYEFGNFGQLKELIDYYLTHDAEREAIRKAGHEHVKQNHTYENRWQQIIDEVFGNDKKA